MSVRAYRAAMIAGAASAVLLFFGYSCIYAPTPDTSDKSADEVGSRFVDFVNDSGNRNEVVLGAFLVVLGAIALIWFASALRSRFGANSPLMGFAVLAAVGAAGGMVGPLTLIGGYVFSSDPLPTEGQAAWLVFSLSFPTLLLVFGLGMAAFLVTVAVMGRGVLPMWLIVFAWIAAAGSLFAVYFLPMALIVLWLLAAGIYGAIRPANTITV